MSLFQTLSSFFIYNCRTSEIMQVNGVVKVTFLSLRYGANIAAAIWIAASSWQACGAIRVIGIIVALTLTLYSSIAFLPFTFLVLVPSLILLPLWFVLVGRSLARKRPAPVNGGKWEYSPVVLS